MGVEKKSLAQILHENRSFVLAMLGVPVFGMAIAFVLILWKQPDNIMALAVIFFLAVQYALMMFFWLKRVETLAKKHDDEVTEQESPRPAEPIENLVDVESSEVLLPEEKRIFPRKEEE